MIPEGMQYASIASTVSKLKGLGMNVIRLTFPIELVDDILDKGGDATVQNSLINALGSTNGTKVFDQIRKVNPQIKSTTTRLEVFDMVAAECNKQGLYIHLDNHISKAMWCCSQTDGNAWFGDTYFDVAKWMRGLEYMVSHVSHLPQPDARHADRPARPKNGPTLSVSDCAMSFASPPQATRSTRTTGGHGTHR